MILQRTIDYYCGMYDYAVSNNGAIGNYDLNVPIPINACILEFVAIVFDPASSGGAATISFDYIQMNTSPGTYVVGGLIPAIAFNAGYHIQGLMQQGQGVVPGGAANIFAPIQLQLYAPISVGISIGGAPLTSGKFGFFARCVNFDLPQ